MPPPGDECTVKETGEKPKKAWTINKGWDRKKALQLWNEGAPAKQIAEEVGVSDATIYTYAKKNGWPQRQKPRRGEKSDDSQNVTSVPEACIESDHVDGDSGDIRIPDYEEPIHRDNEGHREVNRYEIMEAATKDLSGIFCDLHRGDDHLALELEIP